MYSNKGELGIFSSPSAEGEKSEFFQVSEPRRKLGLGIFSSFQEYEENMENYEEYNMKKRSYVPSTAGRAGGERYADFRMTPQGNPRNSSKSHFSEGGCPGSAKTWNISKNNSLDSYTIWNTYFEFSNLFRRSIISKISYSHFEKAHI